MAQDPRHRWMSKIDGDSPSARDTVNQCCCNAGAASSTLAQHYSNIRSMSGVRWGYATLSVLSLVYTWPWQCLYIYYVYSRSLVCQLNGTLAQYLDTPEWSQFGKWYSYIIYKSYNYAAIGQLCSVVTMVLCTVTVAPLPPGNVFYLGPWRREFKYRDWW